MEAKVDHSDRTSLNKLTKMLKELTEQSKTKHPKKQLKPSKKRVSNSQPKSKSTNSKHHKPLDEEIENIENISKSPKSRKKRRPKTKTKNESKVQTNLDSFVSKVPETQKDATKLKGKSFKRSDSSDSCDLPIFKPIKKPEVNKKAKKRKSFIWYGLTMPSADEILKDQKELDQYKHQFELFQPLCDKKFDLPSPTKQLKSPDVDYLLLDCKDISLKYISKYFKRNVDYFSGIVHSKIYNERHERYHNIDTKPFTCTTKDLTYNTSMTVFTFEQICHMVSLLQEEFDPEDKMTRYFFQVLVPELCLKIFMDEHKMNRKEAMLYLDERPVD